MRDRPSSSELFAWTLLGGALGLVAGFALGEWLGPLTPERVGRELGALRRRGDRLGAGGTAAAARAALEADPDLRELALDAVAVGPGVVELHGWVPSRRLRARAARAVAAADGIDSLVNCLLVRGEDDTADATDRPA
jgi:hypothetical protein